MSIMFAFRISMIVAVLCTVAVAKPHKPLVRQEKIKVHKVHKVQDEPAPPQERKPLVREAEVPPPVAEKEPPKPRKSMVREAPVPQTEDKQAEEPPKPHKSMVREAPVPQPEDKQAEKPPKPHKSMVREAPVPQPEDKQAEKPPKPHEYDEDDQEPPKPHKSMVREAPVPQTEDKHAEEPKNPIKSMAKEQSEDAAAPVPEDFPDEDDEEPEGKSMVQETPVPLTEDKASLPETMPEMSQESSLDLQELKELGEVSLGTAARQKELENEIAGLDDKIADVKAEQAKHAAKAQEFQPPHQVADLAEGTPEDDSYFAPGVQQEEVAPDEPVNIALRDNDEASLIADAVPRAPMLKARHLGVTSAHKPQKLQKDTVITVPRRPASAESMDPFFQVKGTLASTQDANGIVSMTID